MNLYRLQNLSYLISDLGQKMFKNYSYFVLLAKTRGLFLFYFLNPTPADSCKIYTHYHLLATTFGVEELSQIPN